MNARVPRIIVVLTTTTVVLILVLLDGFVPQILLPPGRLLTLLEFIGALLIVDGAMRITVISKERPNTGDDNSDNE